MPLLSWLLFACDSTPSAPAPAPPTAPVSPPTVQAPPPATVGPRVVFLGDSVTAGLGVSIEQAFPAQVGAAMKAAGTPIDVVNAGVSGDTTAGGLRRADWVLGQKPAVLVLALGANDMLRGVPAAEAKQNLTGILEKARDAQVRVLLLGMKSDPSLGTVYNAEFDAIYPALADTFDLPLVPFMLQGVAGVATLNQADGIHPTPEGHAVIKELVLPKLQAVLAKP